MSDAFRSLEERRSRIEQVRENSTRPGRAFRHYATTGGGVVIEPDVFDFEVAFIELPNFTFGASMSEDVDLPEDPPTFYCAGVWRWRKSARGFYTGAWCWFNVDSYETGIAMDFSLSWEGVASKDIVSTPGFPINKLDV
jgi:hypothetical protein